MDEYRYISIYQRYTHYLDKNIKIFFFGFIVYSIGAVLAATFPSSFVFKIIQVFQTIGLFSIMFASASIMQFKFNNSYVGILIVLYFAWTFFIILHGLEYEYQNLKTKFSGELLTYFVPIVFFIPKNLKFYKRVFDVIIILSLCFIGVCLLYTDLVFTYVEENVTDKFVFEYFVKFLGVPIGFVLFTYIYHSPNRNKIALFVLVAILLIATYRARRAIMVLTSIHLIIFMVTYYFTSNRKLLITCFFTFFIVLVAVYGEKLYQEQGSALLENVLERGMEDTRIRVEKAFIDDFETIDWIVGRGINGKYWCPNIDLNDTSGYRIMIETDYLNIILKGGIIYLGLIFLISIPAAFLALFRSQNLLSKAAGIWIVLWILSLYPLNVFNPDFNHLLFWICISIGYSQDIRQMSNETIKTAFNEK